MSSLRSTSRTRATLIEAAIRLGWASLAALHVLPLCRTSAALMHQGATLPRLAVWATLVLFLAFFVLKALGVGFLRVQGRRASLIAFIVCCGLIHGDDVKHWVKDPAQHAATWAVVTTAIASLPPVVRSIRRRARRLIDGLRAALAALLGHSPRLFSLGADIGWRAGPEPGRRLGVPRGPPPAAC